MQVSSGLSIAVTLPHTESLRSYMHKYCCEKYSFIENIFTDHGLLIWFGHYGYWHLVLNFKVKTCSKPKICVSVCVCVLFICVLCTSLCMSVSAYYVSVCWVSMCTCYVSMCVVYLCMCLRVSVYCLSLYVCVCVCDVYVVYLCVLPMCICVSLCVYWHVFVCVSRLLALPA